MYVGMFKGKTGIVQAFSCAIERKILGLVQFVDVVWWRGASFLVRIYLSLTHKYIFWWRWWRRCCYTHSITHTINPKCAQIQIECVMLHRWLSFSLFTRAFSRSHSTLELYFSFISHIVHILIQTHMHANIRQ